MSAAPILLCGAPGSPYTRKMVAALRYRRIPYQLISPLEVQKRGLPQPKVPLLPTFFFTAADGSVTPVTDSTPLITRLDHEHPARQIRPCDPALCFLDALIEDYADEWLTKAMFHYRWHFAADADKAGTLLPMHSQITLSQDAADHLKSVFTDRQVGRLRYVGSSPATAGMIEASYERFVMLFAELLQQRPYVLGGAPGASDFAIYGQLTQLALFDPTPMALTLARAPRVFAWVQVLEDISGEEGALSAADAADLAPLAPLLGEIGRVYAPVLLANEAAIKAGQSEFATTLDGSAWQQNVFPYHLKCLNALRQHFAGLDGAAKTRLQPLLEVSGLLPMLHAAASPG